MPLTAAERAELMKDVPTLEEYWAAHIKTKADWEQQFTHSKRFYVLELSGETVVLAEPPRLVLRRRCSTGRRQWLGRTGQMSAVFYG